MKSAIYRFARVLIAQGIAAAIAVYGGYNVPYLNITVGAVITAFFKLIRDKFPKSKVLEWLPL